MAQFKVYNEQTKSMDTVEVANPIAAYCGARDCYVYFESMAGYNRTILLDNMGSRDDGGEWDATGNAYNWELKEHSYKAGCIIDAEVLNEAWDSDVKEYAEDAEAWSDVAQSIHEIVSAYAYNKDMGDNGEYDDDDEHGRNENN